MAELSGRGRWRLTVRCAALAAAIVLLLPILPWPAAAMIVPAASPLVMICTAIATRSLSVATLVGLPVLIAVLVRRRWFCRWACPTGLLADRVGSLRACKPRLRRVPPLGQWIAIIALVSACFGYPLLLWLDPLALLSGYVGLCSRSPSMAGMAAGVGLSLVLVLSLLWPGVWCRRLCPLGGAQDLLAVRPLARRPAAHPAATGRWALSRRWFLGAGIAAGWALWVLRPSGSRGPRPLRPPGVCDEKQLGGRCIRCGNCIRACPTGILHPDLGDHGLTGLMTPVVRFQQGDPKSYCREDCRRCTEVCPSGAIARLSLPEKRHARMGLAVVDMETCIVNQAECELCVKACPYQAIKTGWNEQTYLVMIDIDADLCPGCGACQVVCPTKVKPAIVVVAQPPA